MFLLRQTGSILRACGCVAAIVAARGLLAQEPATPYRVPVSGNNAVVHAGPGSTHYGTDRLPPGTTVDVYRHDPGGWMAIRPPAGSFSLLQRDELELLPDGLARVKSDDTVAWIGTRLTPVDNPMWQIRLKQGEVVEVLGMVDREKFELGADEPDWIQIMPPKGEFRWIAASDLDLSERQPLPAARDSGAVAHSTGDIGSSDPDRASSSRDADPAPSRRESTRVRNRNPQSTGAEDSWAIEVDDRTRARDGSQTPVPGHDLSRSTAAREPESQGWQPARQTIANFVSQRSGFSADVQPANAGLPAWNQPAFAEGEVSHIRAGIFDSLDSAGVNYPGTVVAASASSGSPLSTLELRLTREMLKPSPVEWNLQDLAREVQRIRDTAMTTPEQNAADQLMEKIRRCREIQAGFQATDGLAVSDPITGSAGGFSRSGPSTPVTGMTSGNNAELLHNYDAFGWLNELVRDGGRGPSTYVLQDDLGRITHHITAPPGLNLRRYLTQRVGIIGNRGFNQQLNLQHVTAERVIAVDQLRRSAPVARTGRVRAVVFQNDF